MTIRFLKPWNGYQPDAVVSGLTNEAALIAGGLASYDLDGGNDGRTYEAKFATDASGNTVLVGPDGTFKDVYVLRNSGRILTKSWLGKYTTVANGADHTTHIQTTTEAHYDAVRLIIPNGVATTVTGVIAKIGTASVLGAANSTDSVAPATGLWTTAVTFSGASSVTLPAGTSADLPSYTVSDWINTPSLDRTDGGTLPILFVRIHVPAENANRTAYGYAVTPTGWKDASAFGGRIWRPRAQAVNGVTTLSNFTLGGSADDWQCHPVIIQYASRAKGMTMLVCGDSIYDGGGQANRYGWQYQAAHAVSSPTFPVEVCNMGIGGAASAAWKNRALYAMPNIDPDIVVLPGFEVNDASSTPITSTMIRTMRGNIGIALAACREYNATPIVCTGIPRDPTGTSGLDYGSSDALRVALNDEWRAASDVLVCDFDAAMAGTIDGDGQVPIATGLTTDALHPNDSGHTAMAAVMQPILSAFISRNA